MRILFLSDNFPPEYNAPATRTFEHCREWVKLGHEVIVITCFPNFPKGEIYPGYRNAWRRKELMDGIHVVRVWSYIAPNSGVARRTLDFVSYAFSSFLAAVWIKCDVIVATSPQFFTAISGCALGLVKQTRWIMEVRDIWPESIMAVGALREGRLMRWLESLELFLYRRAHRIVVVTESFKANICGRGVPPEKVFVVKNGVDISLFAGKSNRETVRRKLGLDGRFIIGYLGTHGLSQGLDFIVESIKDVNDPEIHFLFVGDGAERNNVITIARSLGLDNITFADSVAKDEMPAYLSAIDVALVPLRKSPTFEAVIPSKVFESAAMGVPVLLGVDGETKTLIESYGAGIHFEPENRSDFIKKIGVIKKLYHEGAFTDGCARLARDFDRMAMAREMVSIIIN